MGLYLHSSCFIGVSVVTLRFIFPVMMGVPIMSGDVFDWYVSMAVYAIQHGFHVVWREDKLILSLPCAGGLSW